MTELRYIRARNLRRLIEQDPHVGGVVAKWCDHYSQQLEPDERPFSPAHIRNLMNPEIKTESFGEKVARKIERAAGVSRGFLDDPGDIVTDSQDAEYDVDRTARRMYRRYMSAPNDAQQLVDALLDPSQFDGLPTPIKGALSAALELAKLEGPSSGRRAGAA